MDDCTTVTVKTLLDTEYVFPDVPRSSLKTILEISGWKTHGSFVLANISGAVLNIPSRIVKTVSYDGAVHAHGPSVQELSEGG